MDHCIHVRKQARGLQPERSGITYTSTSSDHPPNRLLLGRYLSLQLQPSENSEKIVRTFFEYRQFSDLAETMNFRSIYLSYEEMSMYEQYIEYEFRYLGLYSRTKVDIIQTVGNLTNSII